MKKGARDTDTGSVIITRTWQIDTGNVMDGFGEIITNSIKPNGGDIRPIDGDISEKDYGF